MLTHVTFQQVAAAAAAVAEEVAAGAAALHPHIWASVCISEAASRMSLPVRLHQSRCWAGMQTKYSGSESLVPVDSQTLTSVGPSRGGVGREGRWCDVERGRWAGRVAGDCPDFASVSGRRRRGHGCRAVHEVACMHPGFSGLRLKKRQSSYACCGCRGHPDSDEQGAHG